MKDEAPRIVRYSPRPLTEAEKAELKALADLPDESIDFSDIPEAGDEFFARARRGTMYRALKHQVTLRLDGDLIEWFKRQAPGGKGYQTKINSALRQYMEAAITGDEKKAG